MRLFECIETDSGMRGVEINGTVSLKKMCDKHAKGEILELESIQQHDNEGFGYRFYGKHYKIHPNYNKQVASAIKFYREITEETNFSLSDLLLEKITNECTEHAK